MCSVTLWIYFFLINCQFDRSQISIECCCFLLIHLIVSEGGLKSSLLPTFLCSPKLPSISFCLRIVMLLCRISWSRLTVTNRRTLGCFRVDLTGARSLHKLGGMGVWALVRPREESLWSKCSVDPSLLLDSFRGVKMLLFPQRPLWLCIFCIVSLK